MKSQLYYRVALSVVALSICSACVMRKQVNRLREQEEQTQVVSHEFWKIESRVDTVRVSLPEAHFERVAKADSSVLTSRLARSEARVLPSGELYHSLEHLPQELEVQVPQVVEYVRVDSVATSWGQSVPEDVSLGKPTPRWRLFLLAIVLFVAAWCVGRWRRWRVM